MKVTKTSLAKNDEGKVFRCSVPQHIADILENDEDFAWVWEKGGLDKFLALYPQYKPENFLKGRAQKDIQKDVERSEAIKKLSRENNITDLAREEYDTWKKL